RASLRSASACHLFRFLSGGTRIMNRNWWKLLRNRPRVARRPDGRRLSLEQLEDRCVPSVTDFRPIDVVGNNQTPGFETLGTAGKDPLRPPHPPPKPAAHRGRRRHHPP